MDLRDRMRRVGVINEPPPRPVRPAVTRITHPMPDSSCSLSGSGQGFVTLVGRHRVVLEPTVCGTGWGLKGVGYWRSGGVGSVRALQAKCRTVCRRSRSTH